MRIWYPSDQHTPAENDPALIQRRKQANTTVEPRRWRWTSSSSPTKKAPQRRSCSVPRNAEPNWIQTQTAPSSSSTMTQPLTNPPHLLSFPRLQCLRFSIPRFQSSNAQCFPIPPLGFPLKNYPVSVKFDIYSSYGCSSICKIWHPPR